MVESTSRYRPGKLKSVNRKKSRFLAVLGHLEPIFGPFWGKVGDRVLIDCAKHTKPIRTTRGSLESLFGRLPNDTTMVGNG